MILQQTPDITVMMIITMLVTVEIKIQELPTIATITDNNTILITIAINLKP